MLRAELFKVILVFHRSSHADVLQRRTSGLKLKLVNQVKLSSQKLQVDQTKIDATPQLSTRAVRFPLPVAGGENANRLDRVKWSQEFVLLPPLIGLVDVFSASTTTYPSVPTLAMQSTDARMGLLLPTTWPKA
jgi:hypothetical protein